jgi:hypothetical protein
MSRLSSRGAHGKPGRRTRPGRSPKPGRSTGKGVSITSSTSADKFPGWLPGSRNLAETSGFQVCGLAVVA